jgi:hypothetical protein
VCPPPRPLPPLHLPAVSCSASAGPTRWRVAQHGGPARAGALPRPGCGISARAREGIQVRTHTHARTRTGRPLLVSLVALRSVSLRALLSLPVPLAWPRCTLHLPDRRLLLCALLCALAGGAHAAWRRAESTGRSASRRRMSALSTVAGYVCTVSLSHRLLGNPCAPVRQTHCAHRAIRSGSDPSVPCTSLQAGALRHLLHHRCYHHYRQLTGDVRTGLVFTNPAGPAGAGVAAAEPRAATARRAGARQRAQRGAGEAAGLVQRGGRAAAPHPTLAAGVAAPALWSRQPRGARQPRARARAGAGATEQQRRARRSQEGARCE